MRILFITSTRIGDAVLSSGLLHHLVERYPNARFTIACGPAAAPLFEAVPRLDDLIIMTKKKRSMHWIDLWKKCGLSWWSKVIDLRNAPITYLFPTFSGHHLHRDKKDLHRVELYARVLKIAPPPGPHLWTSPAHEQGADGMLKSPDAPVLAIGPTANWRGKTWRADRFLDLATRLTAPKGPMAGFKIALFGHSSERTQAQPLIDGLPRDQKIDLIGDFSLPCVFACLKRCAFYIGNDSGLMHMASAAHIPTLGLFGPTFEKLYAPWGDTCATVRTDIAVEDLFGADFNHKTTDSMMDSLSVDKVYDATLSLWDKTRTPHV